MNHKSSILLLIMALSGPGSLMGQSSPLSRYTIYNGSVHSHTIHTQSHGAHLEKIPGHDKYMNVNSDHVSIAVNSKLKPDWEEHQGPPAKHFALAKENGYDFYITTDHSQEISFHPPSADNPNWEQSIREANAATDAGFIGLTGFECSENNGPVGKGHLNIINTAEYVNALAPGVDIPAIYSWLKNVPANGEGPVLGSFNHPGKDQYDNWGHRDAEITEIITMLEMINSNKRIHYAGFIAALDNGWKVSPVCGNDNHDLWGISHHSSRTFVLAEERSKTAILDAMKNRRTYASLDQNIQCGYTVNGKIMGTTLNGEKKFKFDILISDPDTDNPKDKITKIDIVKDGGEVVQSYSPDPAHSVSWSPEIRDKDNKYFFIRVWNAEGGDASGADPEKPIAWLAPVWTGR